MGKETLLFFKVSDELYEIGLNGRVAITVGLFNPENNIQNFDMEDKICSQVVLKPRILGVNQLMDIYLYHVQKWFQKEKVLLETKGPLTLDWGKMITEKSILDKFDRKQIFENRTYKYLSPTLRGHGENFTKRFTTLCHKVAYGIF